LAYLIKDQAGYTSVWGYFRSPQNTLRCRHWYHSGSESAWRVGTGFRGKKVKGSKKDTCQGWVKSAEYHNTHVDGGYIYEAYLAIALERIIEAWVEKNNNKAILCPGSITQIYTISGDEKVQTSYKSFLVNQDGEDYPEASSKLSGIVNEYGEERINKEVLSSFLVNQPDGPRSNEDYANMRFNLGQATTEQQKGFTITRDGKGLLKKEMVTKNLSGVNESDFIKRGVKGLWEIVLSCLDTLDNTAGPFRHETLDLNYMINSYHMKIPDTGDVVVIEVAYTDPVDLSYLHYFTEAMNHIKSPICWVRSVYLKSSPISSFGNKRDFLWEFAFLVQKPCDYETQTSIDLMKMVGADKGLNKKNSAQKVGGASYILLAVHNESSSPLIKAFKKSKGFPLFKGKYSVRGSVQSDPYLVMLLREAIHLGVQEYITFQTVGKRRLTKGATDPRIQGRHGNAGIRRARAFDALISPANVDYDPTQLSKDFYELFVDNKVNGSRPGWTMFDSINTSAGSLFTFVCKNIIDCVIPERGDEYKLRVAEHISLFKGQSITSYPGSSNSIQRLIIRAIALDVDPFDGVTADHSAELLRAVKGR
jgi:hypothetical protein